MGAEKLNDLALGSQTWTGPEVRERRLTGRHEKRRRT